MYFNTFRSQGGEIRGNVGAASRGKIIDLLVQGTDKYLWHKEYNGSSWGNWQGIDSSLELGSSPVVCISGMNNLLVFARGADGQLWHKVWVPKQWGKWQSLGGQIYGQPAALSRNQIVVDVFARGADNRLWQKVWDGGKWLDWHLLDSSLELGSSPVVTSTGENGLNVFARGADGQLWHKGWSEHGWENWQCLGGQIIDEPSAICSTTTITVFGRGMDNMLWSISYDGKWRSWEMDTSRLDSSGYGIKFSSTPTVIKFLTGVWLFFRGVDKQDVIEVFYKPPEQPVVKLAPPPPEVTWPFPLRNLEVDLPPATWTGIWPDPGIIKGVIVSVNVLATDNNLKSGDTLRFIQADDRAIVADIPVGGKLEGANLLRFTPTRKSIHFFANVHLGSDHTVTDIVLSVTFTTG